MKVCIIANVKKNNKKSLYIFCKDFFQIINLCIHYCLSHQTLVLNLSGPILATAAATFVAFVESSEIG
jgi:hypothetical protein